MPETLKSVIRPTLSIVEGKAGELLCTVHPGEAWRLPTWGTEEEPKASEMWDFSR